MDVVCMRMASDSTSSLIETEVYSLELFVLQNDFKSIWATKGIITF